jgi:hypothetical protein
MIPAFPLAEYRGARLTAEPALKPLITPLHVFAAHRESFDVIVRRNVQKPAVLDALFEALPLAENGWDRGSLKLRHIGNSERLYPIWRLERG